MTIYRFKKSACMHECEKFMIEMLIRFNIIDVRMKKEEDEKVFYLKIMSMK